MRVVAHLGLAALVAGMPVLPDVAGLAAQPLLVDQRGARVLYFQVFLPSAMMMKAQQGLLEAGQAMLAVLLQLSLLPGM